MANCLLVPGHLSCFTDGSRQDDQSGAGYVVYWQGREWLTASWSLGTHATVFQAELEAVRKLAVDLCVRNISNAEVIIHCDSKSAIMSLEARAISSRTVLGSRRAIEGLLERGNSVVLRWVPGHVDVPGNERADELAKRGSSTPFVGAEPALPLPLCSTKSAVRRRTTAAHTRSWTAGQTGRFTYSLLPAPDKKLSCQLLSLSRGRMRVIIRMLTLHNGLNDHLFRIGRHPNSLCPRCEEGRETPTHVFEQCVALTALKFSIFGSIATTLVEVVRDRRMAELSRFVSLAALSC